jgi:hypothetical protein
MTEERRKREKASTERVQRKQTPMDIYKAALLERDSPDPLKKRQACEKGWLSVTEAVDLYLITKGIHVPKGTAESHVKRNKALDKLAVMTPEARILADKFSIVADKLHGTCFYAGEDSPYYDTVLKKTVREILELTGQWEN